MNLEQRMNNLEVPKDKIDVVLDTDAYNEIDDQFAICYMLRSKEKINVKAIYAAPFLNEKSTSAYDGMKKSHDEICKIIDLADERVDVFAGSSSFLEDESSPVISDAAKNLATLAESYTPQNPLYIVGIAAITNIASAILLNPNIIENAVVVWIGGNAYHYHDSYEFNMYQDVAAARVVMNSGIPFVHLPAQGVVSNFTISKCELEYWLKGKNKMANYLAENTINEAERYAKGTAWTRVIWDVTAVAWLQNDKEQFMLSQIIPTPIPTYDYYYAFNPKGMPMRYIYHIKRDPLMNDLIVKLLADK